MKLISLIGAYLRVEVLESKIAYYYPNKKGRTKIAQMRYETKPINYRLYKAHTITKAYLYTNVP